MSSARVSWAILLQALASLLLCLPEGAHAQAAWLARAAPLESLGDEGGASTEPDSDQSSDTTPATTPPAQPTISLDDGAGDGPAGEPSSGGAEGGAGGDSAVDSEPPPAGDGAANRPLAMGDPSRFLPRRVGWSWDLELGLGLRIYERDVDADRFSARVRAGVLWAHEPYFVAVGATGEFGGLASPGVGGQVSLTHLYRGLWGQIGVSWLPEDDVAMAALSAGWSLFGIEWQVRNERGDGLFLHLRIPVGTTWFLFTREPTAPRPRSP